jgi:hypothetical protein
MSKEITDEQVDEVASKEQLTPEDVELLVDWVVQIWEECEQGS